MRIRSARDFCSAISLMLVVLGCQNPDRSRSGGNDGGGVGGSGGNVGPGGSGGDAGAGGAGGGSIPRRDSGVHSPPDAGSPADLTVGGIPEGGMTCGDQTMPLPFEPTTPDVLIVFDRSGSMNGKFGTGTRYTVEAMVLKEVVAAYETRVRFGFSQFPSKGGVCPAGYAMSCCADRPSVEVGFGNAAAISKAIDDAGPVNGNTPTSEALRFAREYYENLVDGIRARYVLLSTDGQPTCDIMGASSNPPFGGGMTTWKGCDDAKAEAAKLAAMGVKVIALGVAINETMGGFFKPLDCLEDIAQMGGAPQPGAPPSYYDAKDPVTLRSALDSILGGVTKPSCLIELTAPPPDPTKVAVFFDKRQIPWDPTHVNGWDFEPGTTDKIRIYGASCAEIEGFRVMTVDIVFGCKPCSGTGC